MTPTPIPTPGAAASVSRRAIFSALVREIRRMKDNPLSPSWLITALNALAAARAATLDVARRSALDDMLDAALDAALAAAHDAVWDSARDTARNAALVHAARGAARDAEWDIAIAHAIEIVSLDIAPEHVNHVRARVDVWRKGYALLCDVDGELYVYAKLP